MSHDTDRRHEWQGSASAGPGGRPEAEAAFYDALAWIGLCGHVPRNPVRRAALQGAHACGHYYLAGAMFLGCVVGFFMADVAATRIRAGYRASTLSAPPDLTRHHHARRHRDEHDLVVQLHVLMARRHGRQRRTHLVRNTRH
jgi:hypothetical protein